MELNKYIGNQIKNLREMNSMTQTQLADKLHTSRQTISRYESGDRKTTQDTLFELATIFNVSINSFFPNDETTTNDPNTNASVIAAHVDSDTTDSEREEILQFIEYLKTKRPTK